MGRWAKEAAKNTLNEETYARLSGMFQKGMGRSRNEDKRNGVDRDYIYTNKTYETYKREAKHFVKWLRNKHPEVKHLSEGLRFANSWLLEQVHDNKSPYTISTRKAALAKLYGISSGDLVKTPQRTREGISRSRYDVKYDKHISKASETKWGAITSALGLRRAELERVRGKDLTVFTDFNTDKSTYYVHVHAGTKGGKPRYAKICGRDDDETLRIVDMFKRAGTDKVFGKISKAYDNHHYRAEYAKRVYYQLARPTDQLKGHDRYIMRKDRAGEVLDRQAMKQVSELLGHNRIDVIAEHYLY